MQIELFYLNEGDTAELERCNLFLRSNKILAVETSSQQNKWTLLIKYIPSNLKKISHAAADRIDYKEVLSESEFVRFAKMREVRKIMSEEFQLPAYVIFTNEELSQLSKIENISLQNMTKAEGVGEKKREKYGARFMELYNTDSTLS